MVLNPNKIWFFNYVHMVNGFYLSILITECLGAFVEPWFLIEHINLYNKKLALQLSWKFSIGCDAVH